MFYLTMFVITGASDAMHKLTVIIIITELLMTMTIIE